MSQDPQELPPPPHGAWTIGDAALALAAGIAASLVAGIALLVVVGDEPTTLQLFGIVAVAQALGTLAAIVRISRRKGTGDLRLDFDIFYQKGDAWGLAAGLGLQIVLALTLLPILVLLDVDEAPQEAVRRTQEAGGPLTALVAFVSIGLVAPFVEELLFRGLLLKALLFRWGKRAALLWSSAVFAGIHLLDPGALLVVPQLFVVGLVLAAMTLRRRSLGWAILAHVGFNLTAVIALLLPTD